MNFTQFHELQTSNLTNEYCSKYGCKIQDQGFVKLIPSTLPDCNHPRDHHHNAEHVEHHEHRRTLCRNIRQNSAKDEPEHDLAIHLEGLDRCQQEPEQGGNVEKKAAHIQAPWCHEMLVRDYEYTRHPHKRHEKIHCWKGCLVHFVPAWQHAASSCLQSRSHSMI